MTLSHFTEMVKRAPSNFILMTEEKRCKIVVFGPFGAGKTTLIQTLDPESKHVEAACAGGTTTIALDFGRIQVNGHHIHIFGTPGQERFEFAREIIGKGMDGAILLIDATSPVDDFIRHLHNSLTAAGIPFVIFLNKCDCIGARPELIEKEFRDCSHQEGLGKRPETIPRGSVHICTDPAPAPERAHTFIIFSPFIPLSVSDGVEVFSCERLPRDRQIPGRRFSIFHQVTVRLGIILSIPGSIPCPPS